MIVNYAEIDSVSKLGEVLQVQLVQVFWGIF